MKYNQHHVRQSNLSSMARLLALTLLGRTGPDSDRCWPGLERLSADTGLSRSSVKRALRELRVNGWIAVERRRRTTNVYRLMKPVDITVDNPVDNTVDNDSCGVCETPKVGSVRPPKRKEKRKEEGLLLERGGGSESVSRASKATADSLIRKLANALEVDRD